MSGTPAGDTLGELRGWVAYLDAPFGLSPEMVLACLVDVGWPVDRLLSVVEAFNPTARWAVVSGETRQGPWRAAAVDILLDEVGAKVEAADAIDWVERAHLPATVLNRCVGTIRRAARTEVALGGNVSESVLTLAAVFSAFEELKIERIYGA